MPAADGHLQGRLCGAECCKMTSLPGIPSIPTANRKLATGSVQEARLSLLTDVGRRYPGYPSPLSPTTDAKQLFPSPVVQTGPTIDIFHGRNPASGSTNPTSTDGSETGRQSRCYPYHGYEDYLSATSRASHAEQSVSPRKPAWNRLSFVPEAKMGQMPLYSPPQSPSTSSPSPLSPSQPISPRTAMLKSMVGKQALYPFIHQPTQTNPLVTRSCPPQSITTAAGSPPPLLSYPLPSPPTILIANGLETSTVSPLSDSGTMLSYFSNRSVDSGLLAVRPLSEAQVAEYRFWRPCGRRSCAFGCGEGNEGELAAARRLFRSEEEVVPDKNEECEEREEQAGRRIRHDVVDGEKEREERMLTEGMNFA